MQLIKLGLTDGAWSHVADITIGLADQNGMTQRMVQRVGSGLVTRIGNMIQNVWLEVLHPETVAIALRLSAEAQKPQQNA